ncbi:hypothetical protein C1645_834503 [Glomus cerebriforme]|uniref:Uncharacterized protein n=1 Tax=Glomus cerebriforme TaxID=658196 RepID=A0A397SBW5_9GLOM|nr:hypothetical protein C1645_834503 [Glomus cerebriforme]
MSIDKSIIDNSKKNTNNSACSCKILFYNPTSYSEGMDLEKHIELFNNIQDYLQGRNFMIFDFTKETDDPLAIRLGWDISLKLDE